MPLVYNNPEHWRARANEARAIANQITDVVGRDRMLSIADEYENLAGRAVQRLKDTAATTAARDHPG